MKNDVIVRNLAVGASFPPIDKFELKINDLTKYFVNTLFKYLHVYQNWNVSVAFAIKKLS